MDEPLGCYYRPTTKNTPEPKPVQERSDDDMRRTLRVLFDAARFGSDNTPKTHREFREQNKDHYPEALIAEVLAEYPPDEPDPTPVVEESQIAPKPSYIHKQIETKSETLPSQGTADTWVDEVLAEVQEHVDIPHWKSQQLKTAQEQKLTKRQVERRFLKHKIQYYVDLNSTQEFSVKTLCALFPERKADTMTALVKELWKEGLVKGRIEVRTLSRRPKKSTCSYVITSLANPSTNYYTQFPEDNPWFKKKKIGTRQEEVRDQRQEIGTRQDEN